MIDRNSVLNRIRRNYHAIILFLTVIGVYALTLLPGVGYSGDTAKFQFVGKVLGTAHEPGSPGYTMLNFLFVTFFPWGSYAFKANLLSAVFAAAAVVVLYYLLQKLSVRRSISFFTSLIFAFTYTFWSQSVIAEIYTLNILFVGLTLLFFFRWHQTMRQRDFFSGCMIYALSFGTHLSMITMLPVLIYFVWKTKKEYFWNLRILICVLGIIMIGAAQYIYLFWRTYAQDTEYLEIAVSNIEELWYYAKGGQFQDKLMDSSLNKIFFIRLPVMLRLAWLEYLMLMPVAFFGLFLIPNKSIKVFLILYAAVTFVFTCLYGIQDIFVYMIPVYYVLAIGLGVCFERITGLFFEKYLTLLKLSLVCIAALFFSLNYKMADQSSNIKDKLYVEQSLKNIREKSLVICPSYNYAAYYWYYVLAEGYKIDSIYVYFPHDNEMPVKSLESYISNGKPFLLPAQRCHVPPGMKVYYCTAFIGRNYAVNRNRYPFSAVYRRNLTDPAIEKLIQDGFNLLQIGENLYSIDEPSPGASY